MSEEIIGGKGMGAAEAEITLMNKYLKVANDTGIVLSNKIMECEEEITRLKAELEKAKTSIYHWENGMGLSDMQGQRDMLSDLYDKCKEELSKCKAELGHTQSALTKVLTENRLNCEELSKCKAELEDAKSELSRMKSDAEDHYHRFAFAEGLWAGAGSKPKKPPFALASNNYRWIDGYDLGIRTLARAEKAEAEVERLKKALEIISQEKPTKDPGNPHTMWALDGYTPEDALSWGINFEAWRLGNVAEQALKGKEK